MRYAGPVLAAVLVHLGLSATEAVLPPRFYAKARAEATYHVQVEIAGVTPPARTPGDCETTGEVVRIFRDRTGTLRPGARVAFTVSCSRRGEPPLIGGTLWTDLDELTRAHDLEAFLNQADGRYHVALWQSRIIAAPTDTPTINDAPAPIRTDAPGA